MNFVKRVVYLLRWGHWPKKLRYPNGIPQVYVKRGPMGEPVPVELEPNEITFPARDEEAIALLKTDPEAYFQKFNRREHG